MKTIILAISFLVGNLLFGAEKPLDPFAEPPPAKEADRSEDKGSLAFIGEDVLKALKETPLDKGTGKGGPSLIRITILRSFHAPLVLTWFPATEGQQPSITAKRVKMVTDDKGTRTYGNLDINILTKLSPGQDKNLKTLFGNANFNSLNQECWQGPSNDGSLWIYEQVSEKEHALIARYNPINPSIQLEHFTIAKESLLPESNLTTFALMIWALSNIDDEFLY